MDRIRIKLPPGKLHRQPIRFQIFFINYGANIAKVSWNTINIKDTEILDISAARMTSNDSSEPTVILTDRKAFLFDSAREEKKIMHNGLFQNAIGYRASITFLLKEYNVMLIDFGQETLEFHHHVELISICAFNMQGSHSPWCAKNVGRSKQVQLFWKCLGKRSKKLDILSSIYESRGRSRKSPLF